MKETKHRYTKFAIVLGVGFLIFMQFIEIYYRDIYRSKARLLGFITIAGIIVIGTVIDKLSSKSKKK